VNQIYVDVNSNYMFLVAVVTLKEDKLLEYAEVNGLEGNVKELVRQKQVEFGVLKQLEKAANLNKLDFLEKIQRVHISSEPFSQKNGLMTNTQKLRRQEIKIHFRKEIENMYNSHKSEWSFAEK
jgi:long-subunit acyl-CoA synthetase (AMP-forming)